MIKKVTNKIIKQVDEVVSEELICDVCGKLIGSRSIDNHGYIPPVHYYDITTGHNDWGNDSIESIENFDVCSKECLNKKFLEYLDGITSNDSKYFNVEHAKF